MLLEHQFYSLYCDKGFDKYSIVLALRRVVCWGDGNVSEYLLGNVQGAMVEMRQYGLGAVVNCYFSVPRELSLPALLIWSPSHRDSGGLSMSLALTNRTLTHNASCISLSTCTLGLVSLKCSFLQAGHCSVRKTKEPHGEALSGKVEAPAL